MGTTAPVPTTFPQSTQPALILSTSGAVIVGVVLPFSPLSHVLGFAPLPIGFFAALAGMVVAYLVLIEFAKRVFFANPEGRLPSLRRRGPVDRTELAVRRPPDRARRPIR